MRKLLFSLVTVAVAGLLVKAADWPNTSGNPQRDGWARAEKGFTKENAHSIELLYKYKADNKTRAEQALGTPLIVGNLITYLGFKEMLVFGGSSDNVFSLDADLNRLIWKQHYEYKGAKAQAPATAVCPGGVTAPVAMPGGSNVSPGRGGRGGPAVAGRGPVAAGRGGPQPQPVNVRPPAPAGPRQALFTAGFGRAGVFIVVTGDGYLHALNTSTGEDKIPPIEFVPANAKVSALNIDGGTIYATTVDSCGGNPNGLYAIDMLADEPKVASYMTRAGGFEGSAGTAIGTNGTVYGQVADTQGGFRVVALTPRTLEEKDSFAPTGSGRAAGATPMAFSFKAKEYVVAGGRDARLYLLDAESLGGSDHHTPLFATEPAAGAATGFASYEDDSGTRWLFVSMAAGVAGYKIDDAGGKLSLTSAWTSREMIAPAPPVTANGLVFALALGDRKRPATLYALDGATGKELYSSGNAAATYAHGSGLSLANGRIYFTTHDNTVLAFGFMADQPQLTGR